MRTAAAAAAGLIAALIPAGCDAGRDGDPPSAEQPHAAPTRLQPPRALAPRRLPLSNAQLAGHRVVFAFGGPRPPDALLRRISSGRAGAVILFSRNVAGRSQLRALVGRLQRARRRSGLPGPLLVMVDQEGGGVRRVPGPPRRSALALARRGPGALAAAGRRTARSLRSLGVNVNLAPVVDLGLPGSAIRREERSLSATPRRVGELAGALASALEANGVAATAKHFPGFGGARRNTDRQPVVVERSARRLRARDERPFATLSSRGISLVMLSTAVYPALASAPAALSRRIATDELRERVGFAGVSISDDLEARATLPLGPPAQLARDGARAGTDLLIFAKTYRAGDRAARALEQGIAAGRLRRAPFAASVRRVMDLQRRLARPG